MAEDCLNAEHLRRACQHLDRFVWQPSWPAAENPVASAVLVLFVAHENGVNLLFTRRTEHLRHHAGQISFPGGRTDPEDASSEHTALRETHEEVGIPASAIELLGKLPDFAVPSGFVITPVLGLIQAPLHLELDAFEVAEAFEVPLSHLLCRVNYQQHRIHFQGGTRHVHAIAYRGRFIWGATAGILVMLADFLEMALESAKN